MRPRAQPASLSRPRVGVGARGLGRNRKHAEHLVVDGPGYVTPVRSVILRDGDVLTVRNADEWHVVPGGRRQRGETLEQTLRREVLEEVGLRIERPIQFGFMHLHHVTPKPRGYEHPYPDFLWLVYVPDAGAVDDSDRVVDDYEEEAVFRPTAEARTLELSDESRVFLGAAAF